jgi:hypothetical protein
LTLTAAPKATSTAALACGTHRASAATAASSTFLRTVISTSTDQAPGCRRLQGRGPGEERQGGGVEGGAGSLPRKRDYGFVSTLTWKVAALVISPLT